MMGLLLGGITLREYELCWRSFTGICCLHLQGRTVRRLANLILDTRNAGPKVKRLIDHSEQTSSQVGKNVQHYADMTTVMIDTDKSSKCWIWTLNWHSSTPRKFSSLYSSWRFQVLQNVQISRSVAVSINEVHLPTQGIKRNCAPKIFFSGYQRLFSRCKAARTWSGPFTSIQCQG
jgi:hypothetical protein